jgi:hypothetical protein
MQPTQQRGGQSGDQSGGWARLLRRYGPFVAIVVVVALIVAIFGNTGGGGTKKGTASKTPAGGPVVFSTDTKRTVDWGPQCDTSTGRVAVPTLYAPPCVAPFKGDNGGATAPGVTADTITIALYQQQPGVLEQAFFQQSGSDESLQTEAATARAYVDFFQSHYETYGRKVKLVVVKGSGPPDDDATAKADGLKVATEVKAFASFGGPSQTSAYADELSAHGVLCLGDCLLTATDGYASQRAPYVWLTLPSVEQASDHWLEFITNELAGRKAAHAGDPKLQAQRRVFGLVRFDEDFAGLREAGRRFAKELGHRGVHLAADAPYQLDLAKAQENARTTIAKMKAANVTTVIFAGDPVTPSSLTAEATKQNYFPEWVVLGAAYTDTSLFGRTYDQKQWAHAFGVSQVPAPTAPGLDDLASILTWQTGRPPPAKDYKVLVQAPLIFFTGLHLAGPTLTAQTFREGLFRYPSSPTTTPTHLHISWGKHGIWPGTDFYGSDDATLIWWDPKTTGSDEVGNEGTGMYQYSHQGRRYLPGQWPRGQPAVFDPATSVTVFQELPPGDRSPQYPSPAR